MFVPLFFWLPAIASAITLVGLWYADELSRPASAILTLCFGAALLVELQAPQFSWPWVLGLVAQTTLAIGLISKWKMGA